jgi:hypothetical protein
MPSFEASCVSRTARSFPTIDARLESKSAGPRTPIALVRIESVFGKMAVLVTDGFLPHPYGRELTGYEVSDLKGTLAKANAAGVTTLVEPYTAGGRSAAVVQFPGGYIAEIHANAPK